MPPAVGVGTSIGNMSADDSLRDAFGSRPDKPPRPEAAYPPSGFLPGGVVTTRRQRLNPNPGDEPAVMRHQKSRNGDPSTWPNSADCRWVRTKCFSSVASISVIVSCTSAMDEELAFPQQTWRRLSNHHGLRHFRASVHEHALRRR